MKIVSNFSTSSRPDSLATRAIPNATTTACTRPDGYADRAGDCDDGNRNVNPGATEVCNGIDDDCDSQIDEGLLVTLYVDRDRDGYGTSRQSAVCPGTPGYANRAGDCDDNRSNVNPGHAEICGDNLDNNCNNQIDENKLRWYRDRDGDTYGDSDSATLACTQPRGYVARGGDCDARGAR